MIFCSMHQISRRFCPTTNAFRFFSIDSRKKGSHFYQTRGKLSFPFIVGYEKSLSHQGRDFVFKNERRKTKVFRKFSELLPLLEGMFYVETFIKSWKSPILSKWGFTIVKQFSLGQMKIGNYIITVKILNTSVIPSYKLK